MWASRSNFINNQTIASVVVFEEKTLSFREVIGLWQNSQEFRVWFSGEIAEAPFEAFFWETPPVTSNSIGRPFEYVLVEGESLERLQPNPSPFKSHFSNASGEGVVSFPNLGSDAILVVPAPVGEPEVYTHLAKFLRLAPRAQIDAFWSKVGVAMDDQISLQPTWLSTAGLGVSWLHLRLDSRPKYYRHAPYKRFEADQNNWQGSC